MANERGPFLVGSLACHASARDFCSDLAALVGSVKNIFLLTVQNLNYFVPIAQQAGQAAVLGRLSLSECVPGYFSKVNSTLLEVNVNYILLGPPGRAQVFPYLSPGPLDLWWYAKRINHTRVAIKHKTN